mmetsp:Transcript_11551/g.33310  ORF Transcript_11551/g.33310 Transcript_11551/m.33310 type:complete len:207 (+) Transcript_11551:701-1321(+)
MHNLAHGGPDIHLQQRGFGHHVVDHLPWYGPFLLPTMLVAVCTSNRSTPRPNPCYCSERRGSSKLLHAFLIVPRPKLALSRRSLEVTPVISPHGPWLLATLTIDATYGDKFPQAQLRPHSVHCFDHPGHRLPARKLLPPVTNNRARHGNQKFFLLGVRQVQPNQMHPLRSAGLFQYRWPILEKRRQGLVPYSWATHARFPLVAQLL